MRQRACNGGTPSCNCGVAIRENLFYKIYDMCYTTPGRPWWENNARSRLRTYQLRDFKLSRFYSKISQQGSTTKIEVCRFKTRHAPQFSWVQFSSVTSVRFGFVLCFSVLFCSVQEFSSVSVWSFLFYSTVPPVNLRV